MSSPQKNPEKSVEPTQEQQEPTAQVVQEDSAFKKHLDMVQKIKVNLKQAKQLTSDAEAQKEIVEDINRKMTGSEFELEELGEEIGPKKEDQPEGGEENPDQEQPDESMAENEEGEDEIEKFDREKEYETIMEEVDSA